MTALRRLIAAHCERTGDSYADIARRGGFSSSSQVHALATRDYTKTGPRPRTLEKLAVGLGIPVQEVRAAVGKDIGVTSEKMSNRIYTIVRGLHQLDDEGLEAVERRLAHLIEEAKEASEARSRRKKR